MKTDEIKNEIYEMKKMRRKSWTERFEAGKYKYDFHKYETIIVFGESFYTGKISICKAEIDQTNSLENMVKFNDKSRRKSKKVTIKNKIV